VKQHAFMKANALIRQVLAIAAVQIADGCRAFWCATENEKKAAKNRSKKECRNQQVFHACLGGWIAWQKSPVRANGHRIGWAASGSQAKISKWAGFSNFLARQGLFSFRRPFSNRAKKNTPPNAPLTFVSNF
jgi:hypothetical protein